MVIAPDRYTGSSPAVGYHDWFPRDFPYSLPNGTLKKHLGFSTSLAEVFVAEIGWIMGKVSYILSVGRRVTDLHFKCGSWVTY